MRSGGVRIAWATIYRVGERALMDTGHGDRVLVIDESRDVRRDAGAQLGALGLNVLAEERCGDLEPLLRVFRPTIAIVEDPPRTVV